MRTTITVRTAETLRAALAERAAASGKTLSEYVREVLEAAVADTPMGRRAGHLRGGLRLERAGSGAWRRRLRQQNWRR